jgi:hypothetical protein
MFEEIVGSSESLYFVLFPSGQGRARRRHSPRHRRKRYRQRTNRAGDS